MATTAGGLPYVEPSDLVSGWPAVSQSLAETLDTQLAAKAAAANAALTGQANITHTVPAYKLTESDASNAVTQLYTQGGQCILRVDSTGVISGSTFSVMIDATTRLTIDDTGLASGTGVSFGPATAYTPAVSGTGWALGNGTATGAYVRIGNTVTYYAAIQFGSTSTYGGSALQISIPVTAGREYNVLGHAVDASLSNSYQVQGRIGADSFSTATVNVITSAAGLIQTVISSRPFTWATSDVVYLTGTYQA